MNILLTGSVAYDYLMTFPGYFKDHILPERLNSISLSFLVESMVRLRGGIAPNIAYTLALLGQRPHLWAAVGEDFEEYRTWLEEKGIETSGAKVIPGVFTASFFVNTDRSNAQIASFYPGAMAFAAQLSLHQLNDNRPDLVVISPNDPQAMIQYVEECQALNLPYVYDPSQQIVRLNADNLKAGISHAYALFVNDYEAALIEKMTGWGIQQILEVNPRILIVITRGGEGAELFTRDETVLAPAVLPQEVIDPTGVGDAFRGGFLTGLSQGLDLVSCGRMGALAATYCLEKQGPQGHSFTPKEFLLRYSSLYGDGSGLNFLNT
jgi:adenosine kinase